MRKRKDSGKSIKEWMIDRVQWLLPHGGMTLYWMKEREKHRMYRFSRPQVYKKLQRYIEKNDSGVDRYRRYIDSDIPFVIKALPSLIVCIILIIMTSVVCYTADISDKYAVMLFAAAGVILIVFGFRKLHYRHLEFELEMNEPRIETLMIRLEKENEEEEKDNENKSNLEWEAPEENQGSGGEASAGAAESKDAAETAQEEAVVAAIASADIHAPEFGPEFESNNGLLVIAENEQAVEEVESALCELENEEAKEVELALCEPENEEVKEVESIPHESANEEAEETEPEPKEMEIEQLQPATNTNGTPDASNIQLALEILEMMNKYSSS